MAEFLTYFKLITHRSYRIRGNSGKMYFFIKGEPVPVDNASDANKFRAQFETLKECDANGDEIFIARDESKVFTSYKKYTREQLPKDPEELLRQLTEDGHRPNKIDLKALMEQVNQDLGHKDGTIEVADVATPVKNTAEDADGNELKDEKEYDNDGDTEDSEGDTEEGEEVKPASKSSRMSTQSADDKDKEKEEDEKPKKKQKALKKNQCPKCGRVFSSKTKLDVHLEDHELEG